MYLDTGPKVYAVIGIKTNVHVLLRVDIEN